MSGVSTQDRARIQRYLRALSPDANGPQFEIHAVEVIWRSHSTGEAAAHIGEFPSRMTYQLRVRDRGLGLNAELVGTFEGTALMDFRAVDNNAMEPFITMALERLNARAPSTTYRVP